MSAIESQFKHPLFYEYLENEFIDKNMTYEEYLESCLETEREKCRQLSQLIKLDLYNQLIEKRQK